MRGWFSPELEKSIKAGVARASGRPATVTSEAMGIEPAYSTPAEFAAFIKAESERWSKVIKQAGIRIE